MKKLIFTLALCSCAQNEEPPADNSGSCSHFVLSGNYSQANCTGTTSNLLAKSYCHDVTDVELCKSTTSCTNGFYYSDSQIPMKGKSCVASGFPLACSGGFYKVSTLSNCPW